MQISLKLDSDSKQSLQNQVFETIREKILTGNLKSGMLMPSTRALNEQLGVSRNTIVLAYDRLIAEGYLYSQKTIGTFVNPDLPENSLRLMGEVSSYTDSQSDNKEKIVSKRHPVAFEGARTSFI